MSPEKLKTSRRRFLIGTALASVAALTPATRTHRETPALSAHEVMDYGPTFTVLTTGRALPVGSTLRLLSPDRSMQRYTVGLTITQEQAREMNSCASSPVLYDPATQCLQLLHEDRDPYRFMSNPSYEMGRGPVYSLPGRLRPGHGGTT